MPYNNYPLTTPEGVPIPIDILEPAAALDPIDLTDTVLGAAIAIPNSSNVFLEIWCTTDCSIGFNITPVNGTSERGIYHLRADDPRLLIPAGAYISGICQADDSGTLYVNLNTIWDSMKKDYQTSIAE